MKEKTVFMLNAIEPINIAVNNFILGVPVSIPNDLSIVGLDNILYSTLVNPPLTSVAQNIPLTSQMAVNTLISRINGSLDSNRSIQILQPELVIRNSVCKHTER